MEGALPAILVWSALIIAQIYAYIASMASADGFVQQTLDDSNLVIQKPYDKQQSERYGFTDGIQYFWVYKDDKPHHPISNTKPRTEIRIKGYDYTSGVWQFEGDVYIPSGTSGTCVMQVLGGVKHATSLQLGVHDGELKRYRNESVASDVYDRWIHLSVIHDADAGKMHVFVDGALKLVADDGGKAKHYFKYGVYAQKNASARLESRWRNIKVGKKEENHWLSNSICD
eukprot:Gb_26350 [translate_table: standard]